jgi:hypothetical protein
MKSVFISAVVAPLLLSPGIASAQGAPHADGFKPVKLVGEWKFQNRETGVKYGGEIAIDILRTGGNGAMQGLLSYDGRQTNDKCSTRGLLSDTPVEAEVVKTQLGYQVTFRLNCASGESPRQFTWNLSCGSDGVCSEPTTRPWGVGIIAVGEKK